MPSGRAHLVRITQSHNILLFSLPQAATSRTPSIRTVCARRRRRSPRPCLKVIGSSRPSPYQGSLPVLDLPDTRLSLVVRRKGNTIYIGLMKHSPTNEPTALWPPLQLQSAVIKEHHISWKTIRRPRPDI